MISRLDPPIRPGALSGGAADVSAVLVVIVACAVYYGSYIGGGFNFADDGHYAQVAWEFLNGADPHAVRFGYGVAWFKVGQALFALFGPKYALVQGFFYVVISASAVLAWLVTARLTGSRSWALVAVAPIILAPAFPPTAFYAFAALLNGWLLLRVAARWREPSAGAVAWAAAGLAVTFQIRPDFGLVFAGVLFCLLTAAAVASGIGTALRSALIAAGVFLLCHLPLLIDAALGGYLDLVWSEYARYPEMLVRYVLTGSPTARPAGGAEIPADAGTLLARPPLSDLWRGDAAAQEFAALVYGPPAVLALFVLHRAASWRRALADGDREADLIPATGGVLAAMGASSLPHYFLFRPDLAHIANFMPGLTVVAAVFAADLVFPPTRRGDRRRGGFARAARRTAAFIVAVAVCLPVALYVKVGMTRPGTGSIAADAGRDLRFVSPPWVDVRVSAAEKTVLEELRRLVETHSRPGEAIVCVPFCPGVAFMTGRRMLFGEFFVDDAMLLLDPGWIDRAVDRTRKAEPGIVIVFDWSIHGTEISRFNNWAHRYIAFLREAGYVLAPSPGGAAWIRPASR